MSDVSSINNKTFSVEELMDQYASPLLRYAGRLLRDDHAAHDVVQQVFIRFAELSDERKPAPSAIRSWLYRATHNKAVDWIRAEQRRRKLHEDGAERFLPPQQDDRKARVLEKVHLLDEKEKQVFLLRLQEGLSYKEIAECTGLKEGHVGYLLHQAVRQLSSELRGMPA